MTRAAVLLIVTLVTATTWTPALRAQSSKTVDIAHTPIGSASLAPAVVVRGFESDGRVGVSSAVRGARHWSARLRGVPKTLDFATTVTVTGQVDSGPVRTLSTLAIREVQLPASSGMDVGGSPADKANYALTFTPRFPASTYRLEVWSGTQRVLELSGLTGDTVLAGNDPICTAIGKGLSVALGICEFTIGTCSRLDDHGRFNWVIHRTTPVPWRVPSVSGQAVVGDQLRIIEETAPSLDRRTFANVTIQGRNLTEMVIMDEMANAEVPEAHRLDH